MILLTKRGVIAGLWLLSGCSPGKNWVDTEEIYIKSPPSPYLMRKLSTPEDFESFVISENGQPVLYVYVGSHPDTDTQGIKSAGVFHVGKFRGRYFQSQAAPANLDLIVDEYDRRSTFNIIHVRSASGVSSEKFKSAIAALQLQHRPSGT